MRGTAYSIGLAGIIAGIVLLCACSSIPAPVSNVPAGVMTAEQLRAQIHQSLAVGDLGSAAESFQTLVARFPSTLTALPAAEVTRLMSATHAGPNGQPRRAALEALFAVDWKTSYGTEPSNYWLELTQMRLADRDLPAARMAAARIIDPAQRIRMYCDRRFDAIVERPSVSDEVGRAAQREVDQDRAAAARDPRSLSAIVRLMRALRIQQHYAEAIALGQSVDRRLNEATGRHLANPYVDDGQRSWLLNELAEGLWNSGAFEQAAQVMEAARRLPENGQPNVSQTLNLAHMYVLLGKPEKALDVVLDIDTRPQKLAPYGMIVLQGVYLRAALQTGDGAGLTAVLKYLRTHETDAPSGVIGDFIEAGAITDADALMRSTLADPTQREGLLADLQLYADPARTLLQQRHHVQWQEWANRPQVQSEVAKWGHVDRYPVIQP